MMKSNAFKASFKRWPKVMQKASRALIFPLRWYCRFFPFSVGKGTMWDRILSHLWWLETYVAAKTFYGCRLYTDARDIVGRYLYYFGIWEPNLTHWMSERLAPGDVFIDVGANVGYFTLLASQRVGKKGAVVAIEALPKTCEILQMNLEANNISNVRAVNMAAWDKEEPLKMFTRAENPPGTTTVMNAWAGKWELDSQCTVQAAPLSSILKPAEIAGARLVKMDVEGAEWHAIQGMQPILDASRQDLEIVLEVNFGMLKSEGKSFEDVVRFFGRWGFHPYFLENDYSARAYYAPGPPIHPVRIDRADQVPSETLEQMDVVFSRTDAARL